MSETTLNYDLTSLLPDSDYIALPLDINEQITYIVQEKIEPYRIFYASHTNDF